MRRILIVEDSPEVQALIRGALGQRDELHFSKSINQAVAKIEKLEFDLALIDVGLPDGDGFQLCTMLKNSSKSEKTQVIFLTSRSNLGDKLVGFSVGADDYIVKPFEPLELKARIESRLKKSSNPDHSLFKGPLKLHVPSQKLFLVQNDEHKDLRITPLEFRLLYFFWTREGHVLSRSQILAGVWGTDVSISERSVDVHIHSLRRKLGPAADAIRSIFAEGYSFSVQHLPKGYQPDNSPAP